MRKILLCTTALLALTAAPAMAADMPVRKAPPPPPAPVYTWSGFYIGIHGGWGQVDVDHRFGEGDFFCDSGFACGHSHDISGGMVGGHAGYNWQWGGPWLFGLEVAGTWTDISKDVTSPLFPLTTITGEVNWLFTFTPRLGVTSGNFLWYVKGGVAVADISARVTTTAVDPALSIEASDTRTGWTVGGGFEVLTGSTFLFGPGGSWVFGVEGNYYDFGDMHHRRDFFVGEEPVFADHRRDFTMWSVLGRLSWKFGGAPVAARY